MTTRGWREKSADVKQLAALGNNMTRKHRKKASNLWINSPTTKYLTTTPQRALDVRGQDVCKIYRPGRILRTQHIPHQSFTQVFYPGY